MALFLGAVALTSCSKEKKIERNLHKGGGEWNIAQLDNTTTTSSSNISLNLEDAGTFTFEKDGTGELELNIFGTTTDPFTYSHTLDQFTLTVDGGTPTVFDMVWEKDKVNLNRSETTVDNGDTTTVVEAYVLVKK
ncbi:MAG: hypothetical protein P8P74_01240 [Crocinitomicaceae bacterium]|nr:hypothetical protein [Crocinitomicaceae bacterium]